MRECKRCSAPIAGRRSSARYCLDCPPARRHLVAPHVCRVCGRPARPRRGPHGALPRDCGRRECFVTWRREEAKTQPARVARRKGCGRGNGRPRATTTCACGQEFWPWRNGKNAQKDCGCGIVAARREEERAARREEERARAERERAEHESARESARERAARRATETRRRRKILTWSYGQHALIPMEELYVRDEATCWLCGRFVPPDFGRKHNHVESPTRDHVVPLSKGGEHKWSNVRLAHRGCNSRRGAN